MIVMRVSRSIDVATAALVGVGGYVHFCLYRNGYRAIPKIGVGFVAQATASVAVAILLLAGPYALHRLGHVPGRLAVPAVELAAAGLASGTLIAFALTRTPSGLFNFRERGLEPAPQALIALLAEGGVLLLVGASLVARRSERFLVRPRAQHV